MRSFLKKWFTFYKEDRTGIIVLLLILMVVIVVPRFIKNRPHTEDTAVLEKELSLFLENNTEPDETESLHGYKVFAFNPNTLDSAGFVKLGFSPKQTQVILNYRAKGGVFKTKNDFKKIYVVSEDLYNRLHPYIEFESNLQKVKQISFAFNPNILDSAGFVKLGFSPKQTQVILNYRAKGGIFKTKNDFKKIYVVSEDFYNRLHPYIEIP